MGHDAPGTVARTPPVTVGFLRGRTPPGPRVTVSSLPHGLTAELLTRLDAYYLAKGCCGIDARLPDTGWQPSFESADPFCD